MIKDRSFKNCFCNHISSQQKKKKKRGWGLLSPFISSIMMGGEGGKGVWLKISLHVPHSPANNYALPPFLHSGKDVKLMVSFLNIISLCFLGPQPILISHRFYSS